MKVNTPRVLTHQVNENSAGRVLIQITGEAMTRFPKQPTNPNRPQRGFGFGAFNQRTITG